MWHQCVVIQVNDYKWLHIENIQMSAANFIMTGSWRGDDYNLAGRWLSLSKAKTLCFGIERDKMTTLQTETYNYSGTKQYCKVLQALFMQERKYLRKKILHYFTPTRRFFTYGPLMNPWWKYTRFTLLWICPRSLIPPSAMIYRYYISIAMMEIGQ